MNTLSVRRSSVPESTLVSRNVTIAGHRTSVRLEPQMWQALSDICRRECRSVHDICTLIAGRKHPRTSLTAAIRVFIMAYFRHAATEEGHRAAGHGTGGATFIERIFPATPDEGSEIDWSALRCAPRRAERARMLKG